MSRLPQLLAVLAQVLVIFFISVTSNVIFTAIYRNSSTFAELKVVRAFAFNDIATQFAANTIMYDSSHVMYLISLSLWRIANAAWCQSHRFCLIQRHFPVAL